MAPASSEVVAVGDHGPPRIIIGPALIAAAQKYAAAATAASTRRAYASDWQRLPQVRDEKATRYQVTEVPPSFSSSSDTELWWTKASFPAQGTEAAAPARMCPPSATTEMSHLLATRTEINERRVIFVVDDEPALRRALVRVLRSPSQMTYVFENPVEALAKIDELRPDLVISDNEMPKMKGFDFLRKVRAERPGIRTLMLTGGCICDHIRAAVAGSQIDRLLEKPWLDEQLRSTVRDLLYSH